MDMKEREMVVRWMDDFIGDIPLFYIEELYSSNIDDWEEVTVGHEDDEDFDYYALPIYGIMYRFRFEDDMIWLQKHIREVSECGFRIYYWRKHDEYVFGINGCGYDTIQAHWIPLYRKWINS